MADDALDHDGVAIQRQHRPDDGQRSEHVGIHALGQLLCPWKSQKGAKYKVQGDTTQTNTQTQTQAHAQATTRTTLWQLVQLCRRLAIVAAAIVYISVSLSASTAAMNLLRAAPTPVVDMSYFSSRLIASWAGSASLRASPLVTIALGNSTEPINETIYLDGATVSHTGCASIPDYDPAVYDNAFLRGVAATLVAQTSYNLTFLRDVELVAPVVDCYWDGVIMNLATAMRVYYVLRDRRDPDDVMLLSFAWSIQDYATPQQHQRGPAGVANVALLRSMAPGSRVDHFYVAALRYPYAPLQFQVYELLGPTRDHELRLLGIPPDPALETPKEIWTAARTGFYQKVATQQTNFRSAYAITESDPTLVLSRWRFQGGPVLRDTWGWVHFVHGLFALDALLNLVVLVVVAYRNLLRGRLWLGDAFVSVSHTLLHRGALVLLTWVVNDGWTLMEFCYQYANDISHYMTFYGSPAIIHADLLTLFLSLASVLGSLFRERIDPALVVLLFELGFHHRITIGNGVLLIKNAMLYFSLTDILQGKLAMETVYAQSTPMRLWTIHTLAEKNLVFLALSLLPVFTLLSVLLLYVALRKLARRVFPETPHVLKVSNYSEKLDELQGLLRNLTQFELATGAALQHRVGVVSDYENCLYIKGLKYASADGIYSSGYVIANGKFLIATVDLWAIALVKLTRVRFQTMYVYDVTGSTVQPTVRLLYPHTIAWRDLLRLDISMLS